MKPLEGKRIKLVHTDDPWTKLKPGDMGTIKDITFLPSSMGGNMQIWISWDSGSSLAMIDGKDEYEVVE